MDVNRTTESRTNKGRTNADIDSCATYREWVNSSQADENLANSTFDGRSVQQWMRSLYQLSCDDQRQSSGAASPNGTQAAGHSFNVTAASAQNTTVGGTTRVSAEVTNPTPTDEMQTVTVRTGIGGEVVARKTVSVPANGSGTVNFTVSASADGLAEDSVTAGEWYFFSVESRDHGEPAWFFVEDGTGANASDRLPASTDFETPSASVSTG